MAPPLSRHPFLLVPPILLLTFIYPFFTVVLPALIGYVALHWAFIYLMSEQFSPYRNLPGPESESLLLGNTKSIIRDTRPNESSEQWMDEYGNTVRAKVMFSHSKIVTRDPVAVAHILAHDDIWTKTKSGHQLLKRILGRGVLTRELDVHKRQRRVLQPAFTPKAIRDMQPIFWDKAYELQRKLLGFVEEGDPHWETVSPTPEADIVKGSRRINMNKYLTQCAMDIIGSAGFGYELNSLSEDKDEVSEAFYKTFTALQKPDLTMILGIVIHSLDHVPTRRKAIIDNCRVVCDRLGKQLVHDRRKLIEANFHGTLEKDTPIGKDLLSLMLRANMAADLRPEQRLSDQEVIDQIHTFMLAGNETTSTAITWGLYELCLRPEIQERLREELLSVTDTQPGLDALQALPYLDKVVREILRHNPPVPITDRENLVDTVVPFGVPVRGRDGTMMDSIRVPAGTEISLLFSSLNKFTEIWGPDAEDFNPDRYDNPALPLMKTPGVFGQLVTFGAGTHNCIGYRFAVAEIKILLFVLLRTFRFSLPPSNPTILSKSFVVQRPYIAGEDKTGAQMPLMLTPLDEV